MAKLCWKITTGMFIRTFHLLLTMGIFCVLILKDTELHQAVVDRNFPYLIAFTTLLTVAGVLYYTTSLMDPGFVPLNEHLKMQDWNKDISSSDDEEEIGVEGEENTATSESATMLNTTSNGSLVRLRKCGFCKIKQPVRSKHCEDCSRCVRKFDHHCPWLENCVGESNHRFFWLFLLTESTLIVWALKITWSSFVWQHTFTDWLRVNWLFLLCLLILVSAAIAVVSLLCCHSYMLINNQTTWEFMSRHRITYLRNLDDNLNPFDEGYMRNFVKFFCYCPYRQWDDMVAKQKGGEEEGSDNNV
ncbi:palmitoyltransferase ZDHHC12-B-like [Amphiura filiformis]|uniref:palmitoyltransferase ZDHHC12-B-like n=1 Tax=Amphiura filiformis TaxID=82378 RepID=UPI003B225540